jgi:hypothetical protein
MLGLFLTRGASRMLVLAQVLTPVFFFVAIEFNELALRRNFLFTQMKSYPVVEVLFVFT